MSISVFEKMLKEEMGRTFIRGEIASLHWVMTCKSLSDNDKKHILLRMSKLDAFLKGEIKADFDGEKYRPAPDFYKGEVEDLL